MAGIKKRAEWPLVIGKSSLRPPSKTGKSGIDVIID